MNCDHPEVHYLLLLHLLGPNAAQEPPEELGEHIATCSRCRETREASLQLAPEEAPFLNEATIERLAGAAVAETKALLENSLPSRPEPAPEGLSEAALGHAERDYEVLEKLGEGGQAGVYRARHRATGRLVALKFSHAGTSWLEREARIASRLEGDLFRRVESVAKEGYAVLELCDGSLRELLETVKGRGLPLETVRAIADRVLSALEIAHERGIIHGDLKPGNVLLRAGVAKVADFGLSLEEPDAGALIQSHTTRSSGSFAGTPQYLPPEQRRGKKADMYAFGRTLAEMLTGRSAATSASPSVLRPDLGPAWDKLLANLTDEDPEKRMTARDARLAIAALAARPPRRAGWSAAGCFLGLVALVSIAAFVLATSPAASRPPRPAFVHGGEAGPIVPTPARSTPPLPTPARSTPPLPAPAPRIQLETDAPLTSQRSVVFRVRSSDANELRLRRDGGESLDLDRRADGSAETALALPEGPSHIEVTARGPGGEALASVDVIVDRTPPVLTLDDVAPLISVVSSKPLNSLVVNGVERPGETRWTIATPEEGEVLSVRAIDRVGNITTVRHRVHPRLPHGLRFGHEIGGVPVYLWALPDGAGDLEIVRVRSGGHPFWLGRVDVTWRQYRAFVRATGRSEPRAPRFAVTDEHPVVNVSFADALAFARWAGLALPDDDDFSRAAGTGRYPWGDAAPDAGGVWRANFGPGVDASENGRDGFVHTAPVGSFPEGVSPDGVADLAGNVAEWAVPLRAEASKPVWGGSWGSPREDLERPARKLVPAGEPRQTVGFRCRVP
jgi:serine/threonine protein kinase